MSCPIVAGQIVRFGSLKPLVSRQAHDRARHGHRVTEKPLSISHAVWHHTVRIQPADRRVWTRRARPLRQGKGSTTVRSRLSPSLASPRPRPLFIRNRSRARLTAGVPGTEHLTRHMVTYGADTGRLIDERTRLATSAKYLPLGSLTMRGRGLARPLHLYQAHLTARVPEIEHTTRRLIPCSA